MEWSIDGRLPSHEISSRYVHHFSSNPANKPTDGQTNMGEYITSVQLNCGGYYTDIIQLQLATNGMYTQT